MSPGINSVSIFCPLHKDATERPREKIDDSMARGVISEHAHGGVGLQHSFLVFADLKLEGIGYIETIYREGTGMLMIGARAETERIDSKGSGVSHKLLFMMSSTETREPEQTGSKA